jgi:hypothetical protein
VVKTAFASLTPAKSMGDLAKAKAPPPGSDTVHAVGTPGQPLPRPPTQYKEISGGKIVVHTTFLADGSLFYYLTIVPEGEAAACQETFRRIGKSVRLVEVR